MQQQQQQRYKKKTLIDRNCFKLTLNGIKLDKVKEK